MNEPDYVVVRGTGIPTLDRTWFDRSEFATLRAVRPRKSEDEQYPDVYKVELQNDRISGFDASLTEDTLYAFSQNAGIDLHVELRYGKNPHHIVEAIWKGLARALKEAVEIDPRQTGLPTVKGAL